MAYGTTAAYGTTSALVSVLSTAHAADLTGLTASAAYHYQVLSRDAQGNLASSADFTFTTGAPPVVTGVNATSVTASSATINWSTDKAADSQVAYGTTAAYGTTSALVSTLTTTHAVGDGVGGRDTTYHYQVLSRDAQGNLTTSADFTFTTGAPPVVTRVNATSVTASSATINWSTDKSRGLTGGLRGQQPFMGRRALW